MDAFEDSGRADLEAASLPDLVPPGARVSYRHYRYIPVKDGRLLIRYMRNDLHPSDVLPRGGKTECTVMVGGEYYRGEANCSMSDTFSYKVGRDLALYRALESFYNEGAQQEPETTGAVA
jgi:hypothetical protein